jgi:hypothetical protein
MASSTARQSSAINPLRRLGMIGNDSMGYGEDASKDESNSAAGPDRNKILLDDEELTAQIRSIAEQGSGVIDDFVNLAISYYDAMGEGRLEAAKSTLWRSVELLFPFTDAYKAAFDLYILEQRGMIIGAATATELIRRTIKDRTPENAEP